MALLLQYTLIYASVLSTWDWKESWLQELLAEHWS